jgi:hypothetical protein
VIVELGLEEARRISFSVVALCSASLRRWLSDARDEAEDSRAVSLASRSLTCLSFLSRKARCLHKDKID